jgi:multidrug resistance efflux pump
VPAAFSQTLRGLAADRPRASLVILGVAILMLVGWGIWSTHAHVTIYAVTDKARIEVDQRAYAVDAPIGGRVAKVELVIGREVRAGDVLVEIDAELERRQLEQRRAQVAAIEPQIAALEREIEAQMQVLGNQERATLAALDEGRARVDQAQSSADLADRQAWRAGAMADGGVGSVADSERSSSEASQAHAALQALKLDMERTKREQSTRGSEGLARVEQLRGSLASLQGQAATAAADVRVLEQTIERSLVRAPVEGHIGELALVNTGAYVKPGDRLFSIIPAGVLKAVAEFVPADVLGRVRVGQTARLRFDGFPWMQYGTMAATVVRVGGELREGRVRVELALKPDPDSRIPMQHGLPATAEIDVEQISPLYLVLRSLGATLGQPAAREPT